MEEVQSTATAMSRRRLYQRRKAVTIATSEDLDVLDDRDDVITDEDQLIRKRNQLSGFGGSLGETSDYGISDSISSTSYPSISQTSRDKLNHRYVTDSSGMVASSTNRQSIATSAYASGQASLDLYLEQYACATMTAGYLRVGNLDDGRKRSPLVSPLVWSGPAADLGMRNDILHSPNHCMEHADWLSAVRANSLKESSRKDSPSRSDDNIKKKRGDLKPQTSRSKIDLMKSLRLLPARISSVYDELQRTSSLTSDPESSEEELREACELTPKLSLRHRRKAIVDSNSLALTSPLDDSILSSNDPAEEQEVSERLLEGSIRKPRPEFHRKKSSADLGTHYPGDLLSQAGPPARAPRRRDRPLLKRHTIEEFANTRAFQASTASIISACEQDKKLKNAFSLLKLIDKKVSKEKNNRDFSEVLSSLKRSEIDENYLVQFKDVHWKELLAGRREHKSCSSCTGKEYDVNESRDDDDDDDKMMITGSERKRREAVWELFTSECVFLLDHLMVLKHCFMEPLKEIQVEGHLMFAEPADLFGNLDEVCSLCELTRDGEVYHDYCLNYSKATTCLEQLRKNEEFCEFEKWCELDSRCNRLQLTDLLISPMQHCTKVPLLLNNICRFTALEQDRHLLMQSLKKLETSLKNLETKMNWLKNFERVQEIQHQLIWQPVSDLEPKTYIPEFLKGALSKQPCERILSDPKRKLVYEGPVVLLEVSKAVDMYMFLFDDILLLTRIKKQPKKRVLPNLETVGSISSSYSQGRAQTEGALFVVHRQPIALDRFTLYDVKPSDINVNSSVSPYVKHTFVIVQITRFQQVISVYTLQAPTESAKAAWLSKLPEAQERYSESSRYTGEPDNASLLEPQERSCLRLDHINLLNINNCCRGPDIFSPRTPNRQLSPQTSQSRRSPQDGNSASTSPRSVHEVILEDLSPSLPAPQTFTFDQSSPSYERLAASQTDLVTQGQHSRSSSDESVISQNTPGRLKFSPNCSPAPPYLQLTPPQDPLMSSDLPDPDGGTGGPDDPPTGLVVVTECRRGLPGMGERRAKSMKSRQNHQSKLATIREKSQSIDVIFSN